MCPVISIVNLSSTQGCRGRLAPVRVATTRIRDVETLDLRTFPIFVTDVGLADAELRIP